MRARFVLAVLVMTLLVVSESAFAQCAMCVTALEQNGGQLAAGFNKGILFLLGMPYFVFTAIGVSWYMKHRRRQKAPLAGELAADAR